MTFAEFHALLTSVAGSKWETNNDGHWPGNVGGVPIVADWNGGKATLRARGRTMQIQRTTKPEDIWNFAKG